MGFKYNDSKFNMWRACIGVIWIDGKIDEKEEKWIKDKIKNLQFTDEQRSILESDLKGNINLSSVLSKITDKKDRAFLAHQIRVIAHLDKDLCERERKLLDNWRQIVLKGVDLDLMNEIIAEDEKASYHEDEVYKVNNKHSIFERIHRKIQKTVNPGDYKFPEV